jgi:hypothetical protein
VESHSALVRLALERKIGIPDPLLVRKERPGRLRWTRNGSSGKKSSILVIW